MRNFKSVSLMVVLTICVLFCGGFAEGKGKITWMEDSFEDFRDGIFDSSGQNLYVTAEGQIKTIHRFDLNTDGYLDMVFCSSHDFLHGPEPTMYTHFKGRAKGEVSKLSMEGSQCGTVADLNKDGFDDLIICPNGNGAVIRRYMRIFWGGKDGWVKERCMTLITILPVAVQVADLNSDGWLDIIVLNAFRWAPEEGGESIMRIYWGGEESFNQDVYKDVMLGKAKSLIVEDIDGDKRPDIVVRQTPIVYDVNDNPVKDLNAELLVYWNDGIKKGGPLPKPQRIDLGTDAIRGIKLEDYNADGKLDFVIVGGKKTLFHVDPTTKSKKYYYSGLILIDGVGKRQWGPMKKIETSNSSSYDIADLDADGWLDVVLCNLRVKENSVEIMWGDSEGKFDKKKPTNFAIGSIEAVAAVDVDGDGNVDIVAAPWRGKELYESQARIFYGDGKGGFELSDIEIPTADVSEIIVAKTKSGDGTKFIFCNRNEGRIYEDVPVYVYWGGKDGFDPEKVTKYPNRSGNFGNSADLDNDGYPELILGACVHAETDDNPELGFNIYWGGKNGPRKDKQTFVHEYGLAGTNVADFNKDGYLDLFCSAEKPNDQNEPQRLVIYYGAKDGFKNENRVIVPGKPGWSNDVADFDKDGWLDIAIMLYGQSSFGIYWGSPEGFSEKNTTTYPFMETDNIRVADLNADQWLDIIATSFKFTKGLAHDYGTRIYWGAKEGFSTFNSQRLRGYAPFGVTVADYDTDGYLDLHIPNYKMIQIRESIPSFLFWGSADGYTDRNRTSLLQDSGSGSLSGDFNSDGLIDIAIVCHSQDGVHKINSRIYYNDGNRFISPVCQLLPTSGPHHTLNADIGNQYDRKYRQSYISSAYKLDQARAKGMLTYKAKVPGKSSIEFKIRSAATEQQLTTKTWSKPIKKNFPLSKSDRFIQYKATLISDNGDRYPILDKVTITLR